MGSGLARSKFLRVAKASLGMFMCTFLCVAVAQDTTTTPPPLTPAQQRAQARAAAAAQRRAENQARAQARAQAKAQKQAGVTPAAAASPMQSAQPASMAAPASNAKPAIGSAGAAPADRGTLTQGSVVFSPTGCVHNGTKAVCTFAFVNQGNAGNLVGINTLQGAQFVDDAHVPHHSDSRYFLDKYGTRQARLYANAGDTGTFVAEYPNVDARVTTGEFHLRDQAVGGITVSAPTSTPSQPATQASPAAKSKVAPH